MKRTIVLRSSLALLFATLLLIPGFMVPAKSQTQVPKPLDWKWSPYGPRADVFLYRLILSYEARLAAFEADEIDMVGIRVEDVERIRKNRPDAFLVQTQAYGSQSIFTNQRRWPLSDNKLRQALAHTIDREGYILPEILKGSGMMLYTIVMPTYGTWWNSKAKTYEYSIERANKLLDEGGFKWDAQRKWRLDPKTNETLRPLNILTSTESLAPTSFAIAVHFAKQCEKVGIQITHDAVESSAVRMRRVRDTHDYDMYHWGWTGIGPPSDFWRRSFHTEQDKPGGWNRYGVRDTKLDKVLDDYVFTIDTDEARKKFFEFQEIIQELIPWIPVYSPVGTSAISGKYRGMVPLKAPGLEYPVGFSWVSDLNEHTDLQPFGAASRIALANVENLNPATYAWADESTVMTHIYEYMTLDDPDDATDFNRFLPRLAKKVTAELIEVTPGKKGMKLTFDLVTNATWHDGVRVTAYDMNYTVWELGKKQKLYRFLDEWIQKAYKTEIPNDHTFIAYVDVLSWLHKEYAKGFRPMPKHVWEKIKDPSKLDLAREKHPTKPELSLLTGCGPVVLREYKPGSYVANLWNPTYFLRHPDKGLSTKIVRLPTRLYDDESFEVTINVVDYAARVVENATVTLQFVSDTKVVREVSLKHVGKGAYSGTVSALPAATYKVSIKAVQPLAFGPTTRTETSTLTVESALMRYLPYIAVAAVVVVVAAVVLYRKRRAPPKT